MCLGVAVLSGLLAQAAFGQAGTATISGVVTEGAAGRPVPAAYVIAVAVAGGGRGVSKTGGGGEFEIRGLAAGTYSLCVQAQEQSHVDPCAWGGAPVQVTVSEGEKAAGAMVKVAAAAMVRVLVRDEGNLLDQKDAAGRRPELSVGVWGPQGLYYPAAERGRSGTAASLNGGAVYWLGVPRDMTLKLRVSSLDLKLGDAHGKPLAGNTSESAFRQAAGDASQKSFEFTVLGRLR
jgi:hypothetical protein